MYRRPICAIVFACLLTFLLTGVASAQDVLGIYWDETHSVTEIESTTVPAVHPAWLVLQDPSQGGGVLGWECRLEVSGPAHLAGMQLSGQAINVTSPPDYVVGLAAPLPPGESIVLASLEVLATAIDPVLLSLEPVTRPSVADRMSYIPGDDPLALVPLAPAGGYAEVAWINRRGPSLEFSPAALVFPTTPLGHTAAMEVLLTNAGDSDLALDFDFPSACTEFRLDGGRVVRTLPRGGSLRVTVIYEPGSLGEHQCVLPLRSPDDMLPVSGTAREPLVSGSAPDSLVFAEQVVGQPVMQSFPLWNTGEATLTVTPSFPDGCDHFSTVPSGTFTVLDGRFVNVYVTYEPLATGDHRCTLDLGPAVGTVELIGSARESAAVVEPDPAALIFPPTAPGTSRSLTVTLRNTGTEVAVVQPMLVQQAEAYTVLAGGGVNQLWPGATHTVTIGFTPPAIGSYFAEMLIGSGQVTVPVFGEGVAPVIDLRVTPEVVTFPETIIGEERFAQVTITNHGNALAQLDAFIDPPVHVFRIAAGNPLGTLQPGASRTFTVSFAPDAAILYGAELVLGPDAPRVVLAGAGVAPNDGCDVSPTSIDFGSVPVGDSTTRTFAVVNGGADPLTVDAVSSNPVFSVIDGQRVIAPGYQEVFTVVFAPTGDRAYAGTIDLGDTECPVVSCAGTGNGIPVGASGQVGLFFDTVSLINQATTSVPYEMVDAHLILLEPGAPVAGWELRFDLAGDAWAIQWDLEGTAINVGIEPEFVVGLAVPLPQSVVTRLATVHLMVLHPASQVDLFLTPVHSPSLDGVMAWVDDNSTLHPMATATGWDQVATINGGSPLPVETPPVAVRPGGGGVTLSWSLPGAAEGCHVYRRGEGGMETRLTDAVLTPTAGEYVFRDECAGLTAGERVWYSYAVVRAGVETVRSAEVEFTVPHAPLPQVDRLLPNIPNPFNPTTELRFELRHPGAVRLAVHDLTGRLVRTLLVSDLGAGPHSLTWDGRDGAGRPVPSGAYHVRLVTADRVDVQKVLLLK